MADLGVLTTSDGGLSFSVGFAYGLLHELPFATIDAEYMVYSNVCAPNEGFSSLLAIEPIALPVANYRMPLELTKMLIGQGYITGTVKVEGVAWANKIVVLVQKPLMLPVAFTATDANGVFSFYYVQMDMGPYMVLASHPDFNAAVMDDVTPLRMF